MGAVTQAFPSIALRAHEQQLRVKRFCRFYIANIIQEESTVKVIVWFWCIMVPVLLLTALKSATAQDAELQAREQRLTGSTFAWNNDEIFQVLPTSRGDTKTADMVYHSLANQDADRLEITDAKQRQEYIQQKIESYKESDKGYIVHSQYVWQIQTDSKQTLVTGTFENQTLISHYRYYLGQNQRLVVTDSIRIKNSERRVTPQPAEVYMDAGPSWRYRNHTDGGLNFSPEDLSLLAGKNPLAMYEAHWQPVYHDNTKSLLKAVVPGDNNLLTVVITLDRKHGDCLSKVTVQSVYRQEEYAVEGWTHFNNEWLPNKVRYTLLRPHIWNVERTWTLVSVKPSAPVKVTLKANTNFLDFRLLGPSVTTNDILTGMNDKGGKIMQYPLRGVGYDLPDISKLSQLYLNEHPGEETSDPGQFNSVSPIRNTSSATNKFNLVLPLLGGVLCLIGFVWMFKQRKAN